MNLNRPSVIFAAACLLFVNSLHADRTCRIVYPERPQGSAKIAFVYDGSKNHKVTLPSMNLSEVLKLPGGEITIAMTPTEITDPKAVPPKLPFLRIPEKLTDFYIILSHDPQNTVFPVKMNLVDAGAGKLNPGETLWYNFTPHRIAAKLGNAELKIDPMGRAISKDPAPESGYYNAVFKYQANGEGAYEPITEQRWWHDAKCRHIGFMVGSGGRLPKIYFYRDFRDPEPTEEEKKAAENNPGVIGGEQPQPPEPTPP